MPKMKRKPRRPRKALPAPATAPSVPALVAPVPARAPVARLCGVPRSVQGENGKKRFMLTEPERAYEDCTMLHLYGLAEAVVKNQANWALGDPAESSLLFIRYL